MRLDIALQGKLSEYLENEYKKGTIAVMKGITHSTDGLKNAMRSQVKSSGLSNRLANTWRGNVYPKGKKSISAAGVVYSKVPKIMVGFEYQTVIRGKDGFWLAIPTPAIPKKIGSKKTTPALYEKIKGMRLRYIYRPNQASLLVHEQKRKTIIAFWLVPQVKMPKLIHFETEGEKWQKRLPTLILQNWRDDE
nr:MAG TPA: hypothetical protein [Caudoviricetes sp.]